MNTQWLVYTLLLCFVVLVVARPDNDIANKFTNSLGLGDAQLPGMDEFDIGKIKCKGSSFAGGKSGFGFDKIPGLDKLGGSDCDGEETTTKAGEKETTTEKASE